MGIAEVSLFRLEQYDDAATVAPTAIITGANSGLGLERAPCCGATATGRSRSRSAIPRAAPTPSPTWKAPERCTVLALDLASLRSVRQFVSDAAAELPPTEALICNAGIQLVSRTEFTEDGIELTFGVNHLGHFALVTGMLGQLTRPARIVVVSSDTHDPSRAAGMPAPRYESAEALAHPPANDSAVDGRRVHNIEAVQRVVHLSAQPASSRRGCDGERIQPGPDAGLWSRADYNGIQRFAWRFVLPALRVLPQVNSTARRPVPVWPRSRPMSITPASAACTSTG